VQLFPDPVRAPGPAIALPFTQLNSTTGQITHLLYHAKGKGPRSVVSHSQGCLQVRNAALTAALTAGQAWTRRNLLWTATGLPISDVEIWPWPKKFHGLVNPGYGVAQVIGLQGGPGTVDAILLKNPHHEPTANYFPKIEPSWLLP
jgi:hypothetical protein